MTIGVTQSTAYNWEGAVGKINGYDSSASHPVQQNIGQSIAAYIITVKNSSATAQDLRSETGAGKTIDAIFRVLPQGILAYFITNTNAGTISLIVDGVNSPQYTALQTDIRNLGTSVGTNTIDVSGTTVALGTSITVA
jgi:hypothetical protein